MAFDQSTCNRLQKFVNDARNLLTEEFTRQLQATYGLDPKAGSVAAVDSLTQLDNQQRQIAHILRDTLAHYLANTHGKGESERTKQALSRIVREQAFTVLNRLAALRMAEARGFLLESIAKGYNSKGFQLYKQLAGSAQGETGEAYRNYLYSVFDEFSLDLAVLFDRHSAQGRLFPRESALLELLDLINHHEIEPLWAEDETIGWIYQYFNSQEERKKMRAESQAPRNSRELAVRNQFFTPRYVVEFLTDNTLGRIWYEMTQGNTRLVDSCRYLVRRPTEVFLKPGETVPEQLKEESEDAGKEALSQEELLKAPVYIPHRSIKDPRCIRMLDPACGSMHFGLYAFDLFERIYEEAWQLEAELGAEAFTREGGLKPLHQTYGSFEDYKTQIPRLIIEHNIHGVDIDLRAVQIAGLSLWQRAQRAWQLQSIKPQQRPVVRKSNIVCAEPMPGEKALFQEFASSLNPPVLGQLLEAIFDKMELAGEAGTLLKIEEEIQSSIHEARDQWQSRSGTNSVGDMFQAELDDATPQQKLGFDLSGVDDESFWDDAEQLILKALSDYAEAAESNEDQKRLFAEDSAKGFAFIDLIKKRFDVVLMNPPFGDASLNSKKYVFTNHAREKTELAACFVSRLEAQVREAGFLGCISNRTFLFSESFQEWRLEKLHRLQLCADLGFGVLDALVETAAFVIGGAQSSDSSFFALNASANKDHDLHCSIDNLAKTKRPDGKAFVREKKLFKSLGTPWMFYWLPESFLIRSLSLEVKNEGLIAKPGLQTCDNFRFVRTAWETPVQNCEHWLGLSKGGDYQPFWSDIHLKTLWASDGKEMKAFIEGSYDSWSKQIPSVNLYGKKGITYSERTTSSLSLRILPEDCLFDKQGPFVGFAENDDESESTLLLFVGLSYCYIFRVLVESMVGLRDATESGSPARHYMPSMIERLPFPVLDDASKNLATGWVKDNIKFHRSIASLCPTDSNFGGLCGTTDCNSIDEIQNKIFSNLALLLKSIYSDYKSVAKTLTCHFELSDESVNLIDSMFGGDFLSNDSSKEVDPNQLNDLLKKSESELVQLATEKVGNFSFILKQTFLANRKIELAALLMDTSPLNTLSYVSDLDWLITKSEIASTFNEVVIGVYFGRWDIQYIKNSNIFDLKESFFSAIPETPPSFLKDGQSTQPYKHVLEVQYFEKTRSTATLWEIMESVWELGATKIGSEALSIHGFDSYEKFLSMSSGYFEKHLKLNSKSRRQAPIYWPLQTTSSSYSLWVYYHKLNEQTLYTCVNDYLEPKLKRVGEDANSLRANPSRGPREERSLSQLIDLEIELIEFRDELLRIAKFWRPDLNDGVQITAAPLWKLFQHKAWQKKLKETWESLEKGDYDWAHLACSIWPERVLPKCHQDRSLAIAHDVENTFWHEVEVPVKRGKKTTGETKLEWQPKPLSDAELNALIQAKIKEMNA